MTFEISNAMPDRHGTVILPGAWRLENYNDNPVVSYMHHTSDDWWTGRKADPDDILGPGRAWIDGKKLMGEVTFEPGDLNPLADKIFRKIQFGTIRAASVGFIPTRGHWGDRAIGENDDTYYFDEVELIEFSIVNIPSNPKALKKSIDKTYSDFLDTHRARVPDTEDTPQTLKTPEPTVPERTQPLWAARLQTLRKKYRPQGHIS